MENQYIEALKTIEQEKGVFPDLIAIERYIGRVYTTVPAEVRMQFYIQYRFPDTRQVWVSEPIPVSQLDELKQFSELICSDMGFSEVEVPELGPSPNVKCYQRR